MTDTEPIQGIDQNGGENTIIDISSILFPNRPLPQAYANLINQEANTPSNEGFYISPYDNMYNQPPFQEVIRSLSGELLDDDYFRKKNSDIPVFTQYVLGVVANQISQALKAYEDETKKKSLGI